MRQPLFLTLVSAAVCLSAWPARAQSTRDAIDQTLPKLVKIFGAGGLRGLHGYSTGFLVSPEGHVATVWNHVLDADPVTVVLDDGRRFDARVLGAEPQLDLAVLQIQAEGLDLAYFDLEEAASAAPGGRILAFNNMFKVAAGDEPVSVLHGVVTAQTRLAARRGAFELPYNGTVYIVDAMTNNPGAGGGVITTRDGRLLGMIGREVRSAESNTWINYAVPVTELAGTIGHIIAGTYQPREERDLAENPRRYGPADFGLVMLPDVVARTPAYVDAVLAGSPAADAGLRPEDLVLFVNDELVQSARTFRDRLGWLEPGDRLRLVVRRGTNLVSVELPVERKGE